MPRTTTRRAATTGLGALAATTALALAAPSATAATGVVELSPPAGEVFLGLAAFPAQGDLRELDAPPLPSTGAVSISLPASVVPMGRLSATVHDVEAGEDEEPVATSGVTEDFTVDAGEDGSSTVELVLPVALFDEERYDEVVVLVEGLEVDGLPEAEAPVLEFLVEATPSLDSGRDAAVPLALEASLVAGAGLERAVEATAGEAFELVIPEDSTLAPLGVESLADAEIYLYPSDGDDFAWLAEDDAAQALADPSTAGTAAAAALGEGADVTEAVESAEADDAVAAVEPDVEISEDGRSALVTPSAGLEEGEYLLEVLLPSATDRAVVTYVFGDVALAAAAAPEPTPAVTQPAPAVTAAAPATQNPGLRSNTGVEGAGADGGLVAAGAGLLVVAAGAGALAVRTGRRGRRA